MRFLIKIQICAFILLSTAIAQITITAADFPANGTSMVMQGSEDLVTFDPGPQGANRTWTIPDFTWSAALQAEFVDPASTPYAGSFPTANHCFTVYEAGAGTWYGYSRLADNGLFELGQVIDTDSVDFWIEYEEEAMAAILPGVYGASWTAILRWEMELLPGWVISNYDSTVSSIDAWGTMTTPYGTFNVLRSFSQSWTTSTPPPPIPPTESQSASYGWVTNSPAAITVASFESELDVIDPNFTEGYMTIGRLGTIDAAPVRGPVAESFSLGQNYPNPFNPTTMLPISVEQTTTMEMKIYNELGELVTSESRILTPGQHALPVNGSAWASGNYFAQIQAGDQLQTKRMTLVK